jgi:ABC-type branched-subunit amino acid transport system substrate-binding protein
VPWLIVLALLATGCESPPSAAPKQVAPRAVKARPTSAVAFPTVGGAGPPTELRGGGVDTAALPPPPLEGEAVEAVRVALLVPLSGRYAAVGSGMVKAAHLAVADLADPGLEIRPFDTGDTPEGADRAAQRAVADGCRLILGPLLATSTRAVAPHAQAAGVPVLSFSSDRSVAGNGTFILGFTPEAEVERVVDVAYARGARRFAALAPNDSYGVVVTHAFRNAVESHGAEVVQVVMHDTADPNWEASVAKLFVVPAAAGDATAATPGAAGSAATSPFDALLVAQGGRPLSSIAAALAASHIEPGRVKILGTGAWDGTAPRQEPVLNGALIAASPPSERTVFVSRYRRVYGADPPRLASLAYDAAAVAAVLSRGKGAAGFDTALLTAPAGFRGSEGLFRLEADGVARRALAVMEVNAGGPLTVVDAPSRFD